MSKILKFAIRFYQNIFSPQKGLMRGFFPRFWGCRFFPTCSQYTIDAIEKYGAAKGLLKGLKRIAKCHPFNKGGYDPV